MKNNKKGFIGFPVLIAIILGIVVLGGGAYIYKNKKAEAPAAVDTETQQINNSSSQTDTSNWKTYMSSELGISVQYPPDWVVDSDPKQSLMPMVAIYSKTNPLSTPDIIGESLVISIDTRTNIEQIRGLYNSSGRYQEQITTIGSQKAYQYKDMSTKTLTMYTTYKGKIYTFNAVPFDDSLIIKALTTFKFTEPTTQTSTSNWKTYTNAQYGFEFKYPADFHINEGIDYKCADQNCLNVVITNGTRSYGILINSPELKRKSSVTEQVFYNGIKITKSPYDKGTLYEFSNGKNLFMIATVSDSDDFYNQILSTFKFTK